MSLALKKRDPVLARQAKRKGPKPKKPKKKNQRGIPQYSWQESHQLVAELLHRAITERKPWVMFEIYLQAKKRGQASLITRIPGENNQVQPKRVVQEVGYILDDILQSWQLTAQDNPIQSAEEETIRRIWRKVMLHIDIKKPIKQQLAALRNLF